MSNQENENSRNPDDASRTAGGGATPMSVSLHTYKIIRVPVGCQDWVEGDEVDVYVTDPPPQTIMMNNGDDCDGTYATLVA